MRRLRVSLVGNGLQLLVSESTYAIPFTFAMMPSVTINLFYYFFALTQISAQIIPNILKLENIYVTQFLRTDSQSYLPSVRTFFYEKLGHYMLTQFLSEKTNYQRWMEIVIRSHEPFQALSNLHVSLA